MVLEGGAHPPFVSALMSLAGGRPEQLKWSFCYCAEILEYSLSSPPPIIKTLTFLSSLLFKKSDIKGSFSFPDALMLS